MNETKLQAPIRIKLDYKRPGDAERNCIEVVAEEFTIPGAGKHRFAVHGSVISAGEFTATHIETGFRLACGKTIEQAIELAREKWAAADPEKISLAIIRARNQTKVKNVASAAPQPPTWSACTEPDGRGMQRTVAVPGMPSAARDAGIEMAMQSLIQRAEHHHRLRNYSMKNELLQCADSIRALKSIAGPVASAAQNKPLTVDEAREYLVTFMEANFTDRTYHSYIRGDFGRNALAGDFAWQLATALRKLAAPAPVQQADLCPCGFGSSDCKHYNEQGDCPQERAPVQQAAPSGPIDSIRDYADFREDLERLSEQGLSKKLARVIRREIYDTIDARVRNYAAAPAQPVGLSEQDRLAKALALLAEAQDADPSGNVLGRDCHDRIDAILAAKEAP